MYLLKLVFFHKVNELDSLKKVRHVILPFLLRLSLEHCERGPQQMESNSAVFASIEAQSDLFRSETDERFKALTGT